VAPPSEIDHRLPKALDAIVMKALAKDRTRRYAEARQLGADLESWLLSEGLPSSSTHLAEFLQRIYAERLAREREEGRMLIEWADASLADEPEKATPSQVHRWKVTRTSRTVGLVAVAAVLLSAAVGVAYWARAGSAPGRVQVTSMPSGATVLEDGQVRCTTPCTLSALTPGTHQLELRAPGRRTAFVTIEVPASGEAVLPPVELAVAEPRVEDAGAAPVVSRKVALVVDSEPRGASVRLGGEVVGETPWRGEAVAGQRVSLELELSGHVALAESFTVGDGPEEVHRFTLTAEKPDRPKGKNSVKPRELPEVARATGTVRFVVDPWATVDCGPAFQFGDTPFPDKQMPVGEYRCTFTNPDHGQKTAQVKVEANRLVKVRVSFR
jgi:serine/threonine-protein kinase